MIVTIEKLTKMICDELSHWTDEEKREARVRLYARCGLPPDENDLPLATKVIQ